MKRGTECPRLNEKVLGKPYTNRYGNNSPTHIRGNHYAILLFV